jgi:hypothetical protein
MGSTSLASIYATADGPLLEDRPWLEAQWHRARLEARKATASGGALLVLDEIQKIRDRSEVVKRLWDEDSASGLPLRVLLLGSSALLVERGLSDSLAGRFETLRATHWSFLEMKQAFGVDLDSYIYFGGYPGAVPLLDDRDRWARYLLDSLVETTLSRDILLMRSVEKPHLLRRLFQLGCAYSGQILSFQKMLGQLQDVGNTTTLAHYLDLLEGAGLLAGIPKYSGDALRQRASSPKLQILNSALIAATVGPGFETTLAAPALWGRRVESAVGAHLFNGVAGTSLRVWYWRERDREVDFVLQHGSRLVALEVKSGAPRERLRGLEAFGKKFHSASPLLVGEGGLPLEEFFATSPAALFEQTPG